MKTIVLIVVTLLLINHFSLGQNVFPTHSGPVGIGINPPNSTTQLHIYRNTASTVPELWLEDDNTTGYTQMAFRATGALFHVGVGNGSAMSSYRNK
jgi:hypothetical protein